MKRSLVFTGLSSTKEGKRYIDIAHVLNTGTKDFQNITGYMLFGGKHFAIL